MILFFEAKWFIDCPKIWQDFVNFTRGVNESDKHFYAECERYGIVSSEDSPLVFFESEEAMTNFFLVFTTEGQ